MIDRRASLFIFLFLFATAPALAGSPVSPIASGEESRSPENEIGRVETSPHEISERSDRVELRATSEPTQAEDDPANGEASSDGDEEEGLASVLFVFLAIAVVFEAAMSAIFDWRIFIRYFEGKGVKTLVLVGTALLVTFTYDLDVLHEILDALNQSSSENGEEVGMLITALLISGGSSAVFQVYSNLGIRNPAERKRKAKAEREKMAEEENSESDTENAQS